MPYLSRPAAFAALAVAAVAATDPSNERRGYVLEPSLTSSDGDLMLHAGAYGYIKVNGPEYGSEPIKVATAVDLSTVVAEMSVQMSQMASSMELQSQMTRSAMDTQSAAVSSAASTLASTMTVNLDSEEAARIADVARAREDLTSAIGDLSTAVGAAEVQIDARITAATAATLARTNAQSTSVAASLQEHMAAINTKKNDQVPQWIGGARDWGSSGGWRAFKLDRTDYDSCSGYCQKTSATRLTVRTAGMWEMSFWTIMHAKDYTYARFKIWTGSRARYVTDAYRQGVSNWRMRDNRFMVRDRWWWGYWRNAGWAVSSTSKWNENKWNDQTMNEEYKFAVGQQFETELHNSGGHRWHTGNQNSATSGVYNRVYFRFKGRAASKCSSCYW